VKDEQFLREVYEGTYRRLVTGMYGICGDLATAEEIVQEAFVRAIGARRDFRTVDNPEAWLRRVAMNVHNSWWRRNRRRDELTSAYAATEPSDRSPTETSPDHVALIAAMRRLPLAQREAIALHHLCDLSVTQVAGALGVPEGTVKARLARGRAALAEILGAGNEASHA
jgi:RNA polymerase sigma-70 factor (ECF subfamily)